MGSKLLLTTILALSLNTQINANPTQIQNQSLNQISIQNSSKIPIQNTTEFENYNLNKSLNSNFNLNFSKIKENPNYSNFLEKLPKIHVNLYTPKEIKKTMLDLDKLEYSSQIQPHIERISKNLEIVFKANFCTQKYHTDSLTQRFTTLKNIYEFKEGLYDLGYYKLGHFFSDMYEHEELSLVCQTAKLPSEDL